MKPFARINLSSVALRRGILVSSLALAAAGAFAGWFVSTYGAEKNVFEVVNTNKMSFRKYAFNRLTGALKSICWNTSKAEDFYVNGESEITLTRNGEKAKLEFVSMTEMEDEGLESSENRKGSDVLATVESRFVVPSEDIKISVTYRFRRDNEVRVDCAVIAKRSLADDSRLSVAYPINRDYTKIVKNPKSSDEVQNVKLYRDRDKGPTLIFAARSRKGDEELRKGIFGAIFSSAPKARMEINLSTKANPLSPTHDRMLTLSAPLRDPETLDDGTLRYTFNFSIPRYERK
ncbi:MAG: hypothetical protein IKL02_10530 [Kiritimatiellae bacterium]|nr:hypothetical protein [Kiritimatiellia bacterium]